MNMHHVFKKKKIIGTFRIKMHIDRRKEWT